MGNTEGTRRGGSRCCAAGRHPGGAGWGPAQHRAPAALCSVLLLPYFLLFYWRDALSASPPAELTCLGLSGGAGAPIPVGCSQLLPPPGSGDHPLPASVGFFWEPPHGEHLPGGPVPSPAPRGARAAGKGGQKRDGEGWRCRSSARGVKGETRPGTRGRVGQEEICLGVLAQQLLALWGRGVGPPKVPRLLRTHPGAAVTPCAGSAGS